MGHKIDRFVSVLASFIRRAISKAKKAFIASNDWIDQYNLKMKD